MNKAEERSKEIMQAALDYANKGCGVPIMDEFTRTLYIALGQAFLKGAEWADEHQAEKDNEPTWEDVALINSVVTEMLNECGDNVLYDTEEKFCREVLKRFNKERKEK